MRNQLLRDTPRAERPTRRPRNLRLSFLSNRKVERQPRDLGHDAIFML